MTFDYRQAALSDKARLSALYAETFPDEDLVPLVTDLLSFGQDTPSILRLQGDVILGHVCVSRCGVNAQAVALLGPLAVDPSVQKQGHGTALVEIAKSMARGMNAAALLVLGDPGYYTRFGFSQETDIKSPYPMQPDWAPAWQSIRLKTSNTLTGTLSVPSPWRNPALWS